MSFAKIRAMFERELNAAFQAMVPPVPVMFDAVQETPPGQEFAVVNLSYTTVALPILCPNEAGIEDITGNVQISCYSPRGKGMKRLEEMAAVAWRTLNTLQAQPDPDGVRPRIGSVEGPVPVLTGDDPLAMVSISAPFKAKG